MDSVFCIVDKVKRTLFEVCASPDVAREHLDSECYLILRDAGGKAARV